MSQAPLVILGSARRQSDTLHYVNFVLKDVACQLINLLDFTIAPYSYEGNYPDNDMFSAVAEEILKHETIIFATPVYWYSMSGLMKTLLDRFTDLVTIKKNWGRKLKGKFILLIAVGADEALPDGFEIPFKLTAGYFDMVYKTGIYFSTEHLNSENENNEKRNTFIEHLNF